MRAVIAPPLRGAASDVVVQSKELAVTRLGKRDPDAWRLRRGWGWKKEAAFE